MLFNSVSYIVFLLIVFIVFHSISSRYCQLLLIFASTVFYGWLDIRYLVILISMTVFSYGSGILIEKNRKQKSIFIISLLINLSPLLILKYYNFFCSSVASSISFFSAKIIFSPVRFLVPIGISFYTFQIVGYLTDIYTDKINAEKNIKNYIAFVSFFPQLLSGPISRYATLAPQLNKRQPFDSVQASAAFKMILWGYFKKTVIADNISPFADRIYSNVTSYSGFALAIAAILYSVQIYCDFSGYSDIAIGSAKLFGIDLGYNFKTPYFADSIKSFWSRWHISLSTWFRDYIYIPLGGNRCGFSRQSINLMVTFIISGLWHGANYTFLIWGALHGIAQVLEKVLKIRPCKRKGSIIWYIRCLCVFIFATFAWVFFRAENIGDAIFVIFHAFDGILSPMNYINLGLASAGIGRKMLVCWVILFFAPLAAHDLYSILSEESIKIHRYTGIAEILFYIYVGCAILLFAPKGAASNFVYLQF